jgi:hypothetical protein
MDLQGLYSHFFMQNDNIGLVMIGALCVFPLFLSFCMKFLSSAQKIAFVWACWEQFFYSNFCWCFYQLVKIMNYHLYLRIIDFKLERYWPFWARSSFFAWDRSVFFFVNHKISFLGCWRVFGLKNVCNRSDSFTSFHQYSTLLLCLILTKFIRMRMVHRYTCSYFFC